MIELLQQHTVDIYTLDSKEYTRQVVPARSLVTVNRFDLFAKLAYIKYRESDRDLALKLYEGHIKVFNPDWREPGRTDKNSLADFLKAFDTLIDYFRDHAFDEQKSLIPVSTDGTILDGSHRIAALAFYDKDVTILRFQDVTPVCTFDYVYFLNRGLFPALADKIAWEAVGFTDHLHVACLWPRMGELDQREPIIDCLKQNFQIFYVKNVKMSLGNLSKFIYTTYKEQDWVGDAGNNYQGARDKALSCYSTNGIVQFVIFQADSWNEVLKTKDVIRQYGQLDDQALDITSSYQETQDVLNLILTDKVEEFSSPLSRWKDRINTSKILIKNVYWMNFKVSVAKILKQVGLYK